VGGTKADPTTQATVPAVERRWAAAGAKIDPGGHRRKGGETANLYPSVAPARRFESWRNKYWPCLQAAMARFAIRPAIGNIGRPAKPPRISSMNWTYIAPILLLCGSNIFMTFAWVSRGLPKANATVRWTVASGERP
jgi:hypothetical protein